MRLSLSARSAETRTEGQWARRCAPGPRPPERVHTAPLHLHHEPTINRVMSDRVQEYIRKENARRGRGEDEDDDDRDHGGLYGMSEWENPAADDRLDGYTGRT